MPGLIGEDRFREVVSAALELPGADDVEVLFLHEWGGLTRFANSEIHQSTSREDTGLRVRVAANGRIGVAQANDFTPEGAVAAARNAKEMADVVAPDPLWPGLAGPASVVAMDRFDEDTAQASPETRADAVADLIGQVPVGCVAAGAYETQAMEIGVATSAGQMCWGPMTQASITTVVTGDDQASGFAERFAGAAGELDAVEIGSIAAGKAVRSRSPVSLDPGAYPVVLEPNAVATLVGFLAWIGFGGRDYIEGRSCFSGRAGEKVADDSISIWDDACGAGMLGVGFDFEGSPRSRVDLIREGKFVDAVYDRRTAKQAGRTEGSTGHGLPAPNPQGPFPLHLFMGSGDPSVEDMVAATDRGLLVTRFHYANVVNPMESSITGMTRDGTFLIEKGEVVGPVRNFRFTQSILGALSAVSMIGAETELASEFFFSASRVPALKIESFNFSGASDH
jgi:predicted Zn-dependent protease